MDEYLKKAIESGNEEDVIFELKRLLTWIALDDKYKSLEETANKLYDYLMEKKRVKDDYISAW